MVPPFSSGIFSWSFPEALRPSINLETCLAFLPTSSIYLFFESTSSRTTAGITTSLSSKEKREYGSCNKTFVSNTYILLEATPPAFLVVRFVKLRNNPFARLDFGKIYVYWNKDRRSSAQ